LYSIGKSLIENQGNNDSKTSGFSVWIFRLIVCFVALLAYVHYSLYIFTFTMVSFGGILLITV